MAFPKTARKKELPQIILAVVGIILDKAKNESKLKVVIINSCTIMTRSYKFMKEKDISIACRL